MGVRLPHCPPETMKVTVDSKKGLKTNLKVFVDKKTIDEKLIYKLKENLNADRSILAKLLEVLKT